MTLLHVIRFAHKMFNTSKESAHAQTAQNMMHTNIYTQISGIFVGSRRRQRSLLCASHNPLCLRVGDVSDASWFSALVWLSLLTLSNNNDNLCCSLVTLGVCDLIVWLGQGKVSVGAHWPWYEPDKNGKATNKTFSSQFPISSHSTAAEIDKWSLWSFHEMMLKFKNGTTQWVVVTNVAS